MEDESKKLLLALQSEPDFKLPPDFASKVVARIKVKEERRITLPAWQYLIPGILFILVGLPAILYFGGETLSTTLIGLTPWALVLGVILTTLQYIDKKLLQI